ncbi:hypothetical protein COCNU_scaffold006606G000010 [Cocos nucifera]|nr:hypothetical protein [Cocos nucifera]
MARIFKDGFSKQNNSRKSITFQRITWFYTLMVLSTALFGKPAFRNLICNGLVLAEDGKKMSKRLKNYPSPMEVIGDYGADALRLYLISSPVVRAEPLRFKKDGVYGVVKDVFLPWYNAYRFLVQNAKRLEVEGFEPFVPIDYNTLQKSSNVLDQWINSATESLIHFVRQEMDAYRLYTVVPYLLKFIDNLTNIYVRFNRKRLKGRTGEDDGRISLSTLYHVLLTTCKAMAPFTPFFTEVLYQNLRKVSIGSEESIHYCSFPSTRGKREERIEQSVTRMMTVIDLVRNIRERHNKPLKTPLKEMVVVHPDTDFLEDITGKLREYVMEELNIKSVVPCNDPLKYASLCAEPDYSVLGKRLGKAMGTVAKEVKAMSQADILAFERSGEATFSGHCLKLTDIKVIFCQEEFRGVSGASFVISIAKATLVFDSDAILSLFSGNKKHADDLQTYLSSRDLFNLKLEFQVGNGKIKVDCVEDQPTVDLELGKHVLLSVGDYFLSRKQ